MVPLPPIPPLHLVDDAKLDGVQDIEIDDEEDDDDDDDDDDEEEEEEEEGEGDSKSDGSVKVGQRKLESELGSISILKLLTFPPPNGYKFGKTDWYNDGEPSIDKATRMTINTRITRFVTLLPSFVSMLQTCY
jgi:ABC-type Zn2+ transport system substrate-binding protein/surface adhesin